MPASLPLTLPASFAVPFPQWQEAGAYWVFASLVVVMCQRLVEHAASAVDWSSRHINGARAGMAIGCIVWAMDVAGFFMYESVTPRGLDLGAALASLLVMVASCRLTVPALSSSSSKLHTAGAGIGLAVGATLAHCVLAYPYVEDFTALNPLAATLSLALAGAISVCTALRHRSAKLNGLTATGAAARAADWVLCGGAILVLHWLLCNMFAIQLEPLGVATETDPLLLGCVVLFAAMLALDQLVTIRHDKGRQQLLRQGLRMMRASNTPLTPERDAQLSLIADHLRELLVPRQLALHFQPIVNLREETLHLEALLRLQHPRLGAVNPELFFLVCELHGVTAQVDRLILRNALDHARDWQQRSGQQAVISVNVAPVTLLAPDFSAWLAREMAQRGLPEHLLKLELTEHAIIASGPGMSHAIGQLSSAGVHVVMDDFGAGYSSLGVLADLPIAGIKCDRLFLRKIPQDLRRQALLRHVAAMARELGLPVIVEGVETVEELRIVLASGIDSMQGYLFARPIPAADIPHWLDHTAPARMEAMAELIHNKPALSQAPQETRVPSALGVAGSLSAGW
ncbi:MULTISPECIES: EAL domain-containing protein [unclassified Acidovorax]|uniref:EAL domain-containing protein n=1 Tax=unclassified Acidovorax TaxID=2684926 RepID=UPI0028834613|nr:MULTISPECIES: EAL domain-containing protein [unclassified Acidovorax]